jgi:hypothetical protein
VLRVTLPFVNLTWTSHIRKRAMHGRASIQRALPKLQAGFARLTEIAARRLRRLNDAFASGATPVAPDCARRFSAGAEHAGLTISGNS